MDRDAPVREPGRSCRPTGGRRTGLVGWAAVKARSKSALSMDEPRADAVRVVQPCAAALVVRLLGERRHPLVASGERCRRGLGLVAQRQLPNPAMDAGTRERPRAVRRSSPEAPNRRPARQEISALPPEGDLARADSLAREIFSEVANKWAFLIIEFLGQRCRPLW